jgi:hypothetical protein
MSLFPKFRRELSQRIGDREVNEECFEDLWQEIYPGAKGNNAHEKICFTCDQLAMRIDEVLEENHFFYTFLEYEYGEVKHRTDSDTPEGGQDDLGEEKRTEKDDIPGI